MKIKASSYFLIAIIIIMLMTIVASLQYTTFSARLLPLLFAGLVLVLSVVELFREGRTTTESKIIVDEETGKKQTTERYWRQHLIHGGWVVGFALGIYLLGFLIASLLFSLAYMRYLGTRWPVTIITTVILVGTIYGLFEVFLKIVLYRGVLLAWLGF